MQLKTYQVLMAISSALAWLGWGYVIIALSPAEGILAFFLFYGTLALALGGSFSVLLLFLAARRFPGEALFRVVRKTFLLSALITGGIIITLMLLARAVTGWWLAILWIIIWRLAKKSFNEIAVR